MSAPARLTYGETEAAALRAAFGKLASKPIFTTWRLVTRDGKPSKVPTHPAGTPGITLAEAVKAFTADPTFAGIGVKLGQVPGTGRVLFGADYDGSGKGPLPEPWPKTKTYAEQSPSGGDRFHVLGLYRGAPLEGRRAGAVEVYSEGRYFTLTGRRINGARILETDPKPFYAAIGVPEPARYETTRTAGISAPGDGAKRAEEADLTDRERVMLDAVRAIEDEDESKRDYMVLAACVERGATDEEAARMLCAGFWRDKLKRKDYIPRTLEAVRKDRLQNFNAFKAESKKIGEGDEPSNPPPIFTLENALKELVFISDGSQVVPREDPRLAWSFADFESMTAASVIHSGGKGRPLSVARAWLRHPARETVHARTFRAGGELFCKSPDDVRAINTWRAPPRAKPPTDWRERARPYFEHVEFLVPVAAEREHFLDWQAHIEQCPGVLPHHHFLLYTQAQGVGRNWMACVLARVCAGITALDVDLPGLLNGGFNGQLRRKVFAVVNEINEGAGADTHRHANRLRTLLTDETRRINPKYGRQYDEWNAIRWLLLSNHETALPLDRFDRRIYAIRNPDRPRPTDYYAKLYAMAADPQFIASVREALRTRDISKFNPGMQAPLTETKQRVIEATTPEADLEMQHLVKDYPADCITAEHLMANLWGIDISSRDRATLRFVAGRCGARRYPTKVFVRNGQHRVWVLREHKKWLAAKPNEVAKEVERGKDNAGKPATGKDNACPKTEGLRK